jgi:hypothetical protein
MPVRITGSLGLRVNLPYEPALSPWLAVRLWSHGETYLRRKRRLARVVAALEGRLEPTLAIR